MGVKTCEHCGHHDRQVQLVKVVPLRGGPVKCVLWCQRCIETPSRWVAFRPIASALHA
jgi:hypothetical protein